MEIDNILTANVHDLFMSRAIELAKQGRGRVSPNPMVGCVLVHFSIKRKRTKKKCEF